MNAFEAHSDFVRSIAVHPVQPLILTSSDDFSIKLWNWEECWHNQLEFVGHSKNVMQIVFNPHEDYIFASASWDKTVKVWQLESVVANFTLEHDEAVNCIEYYHGTDKPYLVSCAANITTDGSGSVRIWDYQKKTCVKKLERGAISAVLFHPELPIVLVGTKNGILSWDLETSHIEKSLKRKCVWSISISCTAGTNIVALGCENGSIIVEVGSEKPIIMSMDVNGGKFIWAERSEMKQLDLNAIKENMELKDGERLTVAAKNIGSSEIYPRTIAYSPDGKYVAVCGQGEYKVYNLVKKDLPVRTCGKAHEFVWRKNNYEFAIRQRDGISRLYNNFRKQQFFSPVIVESLFGYHLLGLKTSVGLSLYDWESKRLLKSIKVDAK